MNVFYFFGRTVDNGRPASLLLPLAMGDSLLADTTLKKIGMAGLVQAGRFSKMKVAATKAAATQGCVFD